MDHHMHHTEPFWDINLLIGLLIISIIYLLGIRFLEQKFSHTALVSNSQIASFLIACTLFFLTFGSPMAAHTHHYLSIHMLQMSVLCFVIPPLLIYSLPHLYLKKIVVFMKYPIAGVITFALLFSVYHIPPVFDWMMSSHFIHILSHVLLFTSAAIMWLPLTPILVNEALGNQERKYLHYMMWLVMPPCIFLLVMNIEMYGMLHTHSHGKIFSNITDQRLSGVIMICLHQVSMYVNARANKRKEGAGTRGQVHWSTLSKS